VPGVNEYLKKA